MSSHRQYSRGGDDVGYRSRQGAAVDSPAARRTETDDFGRAVRPEDFTPPSGPRRDTADARPAPSGPSATRKWDRNDPHASNRDFPINPYDEPPWDPRADPWGAYGQPAYGGGPGYNQPYPDYYSQDYRTPREPYNARYSRYDEGWDPPAGPSGRSRAEVAAPPTEPGHWRDARSRRQDERAEARYDADRDRKAYGQRDEREDNRRTDRRRSREVSPASAKGRRDDEDRSSRRRDHATAQGGKSTPKTNDESRADARTKARREASRSATAQDDLGNGLVYDEDASRPSEARRDAEAMDTSTDRSTRRTSDATTSPRTSRRSPVADRRAPSDATAVPTGPRITSDSREESWDRSRKDRDYNRAAVVDLPIHPSGVPPPEQDDWRSGGWRRSQQDYDYGYNRWADERDYSRRPVDRRSPLPSRHRPEPASAARERSAYPSTSPTASRARSPSPVSRKKRREYSPDHRNDAETSASSAGYGRRTSLVNRLEHDSGSASLQQRPDPRDSDRRWQSDRSSATYPRSGDDGYADSAPVRSIESKGRGAGPANGVAGEDAGTAPMDVDPKQQAKISPKIDQEAIVNGSSSLIPIPSIRTIPASSPAPADPSSEMHYTDDDEEAFVEAADPPRALPTELYTRIAQVGEGTYGQVFKAKSEHTGIFVALKKIRLENEKDGFPITAMREIKLLQMLRHRNIVRLHEMMTARGSVYMVFEYMEHDLNGVLNHPNVHFTPAHLKSLASQLLQGLDYLHRKAVLHRDLKGSNILLNNAGLLKLADFGLARMYAKHKSGDYTNRVVTLWYRPPELLLGATKYGAEVDLWGAGCIFLELFTRRPVFQGQDEIHQLQVLMNVLGGNWEERWEGVERLPWWELVKPTERKKKISDEPVAEESAAAVEVVKGEGEGSSPRAEERDEPQQVESSPSHDDSIQPWSVHFHNRFSKLLSPTALTLAEQLLHLDPRQRISASKALQMDYFTTEKPKERLPSGVLSALKGEWHELESRRARQKAAKSSVVVAS